MERAVSHALVFPGAEEICRHSDQGPRQASFSAGNYTFQPRVERGLGQGRRSAGTGWHGHLIGKQLLFQPLSSPYASLATPVPSSVLWTIQKLRDLHLVQHLPPAPCKLCLGCHGC
ncbi:unnamed protein product [Rangifer tarandus platyrhynchus]|uniref:Uncharacterized protein n=1 Tax=Rangifer tarandus platyrhynchus TaxID=3082113 RepID=A0AC59ZDK1_RANTA